MDLIRFFEQNWRNLLWSAGILAATIAVALVVRAIAFWLLLRLSRRKGAMLGQSLLKRGRHPSLWILPLVAVLVVLPELPLVPALMDAAEHIVGLGLIAAVAWLAILLIEVTSDVLHARYRVDAADNLVARRIETQFLMLQRIARVLVSIVALSIMLMTFQPIRQIGISILASAGLASLVVGMAMKETLSNLIAGVQIAFAQPFRIGDAVVVENEWGWIEEIGLMYVIVRIWDLRRLVLPLSYFLDHPFQNWTRTSADLLAYTYLYVDYSAPVDALREELRRILESSPMWSKKVCILQVADSDRYTMQLRALMDVGNSSDAWDLRCLVREKLVDFLQKNYPVSLPRYRGELEMSAANAQVPPNHGTPGAGTLQNDFRS